MEHGASELVKEESHMVMTVKAEVDKAAQCTAYHGVQTNANSTEEEPGLAELVKSEAALLVKEEVVEDGWQDIPELQCMQGPSTSAIVGSANVPDSIGDLHNILNVKEELGAIDIGPTVLQHTDTWYTTNQKDVSVVKEERTINHDKTDPILCVGVKEEIIEDEQRVLTGAGLVLPAGSLTPQDSLMEQPRACTALHSLRKECLETVCRVELIRLDTFQCEVCDAVYIDAHKLLQHVQNVHGPGPRGSLRQHVKSPQISKEGQQCATAKIDAQRSNKAGQSKQRVPSQLYSCDECAKTYTSKASLMYHYKNRHSTESHKCTKCNKIFPSKSYLHRHTSYAHSEQQHECAVCKKILRSKTALRLHLRHVHQPRPAVVHTCEYCHKTYATKRGLIYHMEVVHTKALNRCSECNKEYKRKQRLQGHIKKVHSKEEHEGSKARIYTCDYCKKMFNDKGDIRRHITRVHLSGSYKCHQCDKIFKCKEYLMRHKTKVHPAGSKARIYTCDYCKKMFNDKGDIRRHITRVHLSGSYKCHQCDKIFKCKEYLMRHKTKVHTAESRLRHTCTNCGQNFSSKWHCQQHEKRSKCARATAGNTSAAASTSRQQHNLDIVKEEPGDGELDLGPVVFQHMDCNYRPYKPEPQLD